MEAPDDEIDAAVEAALDTAPSETHPQQETSARELAALEERIAAERKKASDAMQETAQPVPVNSPEEEEPMVSVMAKGLDYLHQKMREHANRPKPVYVPPPMTDGMRARIEEEQAAGRRAVEKHAAQQASRPVPVRDPSEGFTTPVYRPGDVVPDPTVPASSGFAAGTKKFSADA